jgi:error-prone DNA polymerase
VIENLIRSGALDSLGLARRDLLWELGTLDYQTPGLDLELPVEKAVLPVLKRAEQYSWEHELLGLTPGSHVMDLYRAELQDRGVLSSGQLANRRDGELVQLAGFAVVRQRPPTAKGFLFITLEDEEGLVNLIVRPDVFEKYRDPLRNAPLLWVRGKVQREAGAMSVLVYRAAPLVR